MRIQREGAQLQIRGTWSAGPGDNQARFLADLRALRDSAAIGYDELAARAHYPSDILKEAENGPYLPGLPILTAYVRACEGDVLDWEERWRHLNSEVADDPDLPVRPAGASPAAVAGARAGVGVVPPDVYDPERIRAALRGEHARSDQVGRRTSDPGIPAPAQGTARADISDWGRDLDSGLRPDSGASLGAGSGWDTAAGPAITSANGNHTPRHGSRGPFDAASDSAVLPRGDDPPRPPRSWGDPSPQTPLGGDPSPQTPLGGDDLWDPPREFQAEEFSWLKKSKPESRSADSELAWPEQAGGPTSPERTDFWSTPATSASADLKLPAAAPRAEEPAIARASWPAPADSATTPGATVASEPAQRAAAGAASGTGSAAAPATAAQPLSSAGSRATVTERDDHRQDRFFPVRLLVVIIIAALIGSALVLLLK
jgi:hypothetical protein